MKAAMCKGFNMEFDVYDPSFTTPDDYWQMQVASRSTDIQWKSIRLQINKGFTTDNVLFKCTEPVQDKQFWGCLHAYNAFWFYRVYFTGRDTQSRPGRHFFVLFKFEKAEDLLNASVIRITKYLETQTEIPLDLSPLRRIDITSSEEIAIDSMIDIVYNLSKSIPIDNHQSWILGLNGDVQPLTGHPVMVKSEKTPPPLPPKESTKGDVVDKGLNTSPNSPPKHVDQHPTRHKPPLKKWTLNCYVVALVMLILILLQVYSYMQAKVIEARLSGIEEKVLSIASYVNSLSDNSAISDTVSISELESVHTRLDRLEFSLDSIANARTNLGEALPESEIYRETGI